MRLRFNIRSLDSTALVDAGSDLEAAAYEASLNNEFGKKGSGHEAKENTRFGQLLAAQGAPDWYFWRFWYSETRTG